MINKFKIILLIFFQLIFFKNTISEEDSLIIQSTTSTRDSGFYDFILSKYKIVDDITIKVIASGTGHAIINAKKCDADIIVVNHHLFFADMALKDTGFGELIPEADAIIFDEAHQIPDIASDYFGESLSTRQIHDIAKDITLLFRTVLKDAGQLDKAADKCRMIASDLRLLFPDTAERGNWAEALDRDDVRMQVGKLAEALYQTEKRGLPTNGSGQGHDYQLSFWMKPFSDNHGCETWLPKMMGYGGHIVMILPNRTTAFRFADNDDYQARDLALAAHDVRPLCPH